MKIKVEAWINDECHEYLMNLVAQGYYGESYDIKIKLMIAFEESLNYIMGNTLNEELKKVQEITG